MTMEEDVNEDITTTEVAKLKEQERTHPEG
jgi:hypothetical protein